MTIKETTAVRPQGEICDGEEAIRIFRNHRQLLQIPIIEVPSDLNPFSKDGVSIFAKDMSKMPFGTVKSGPAFQMLEKLSQKGALSGATLVEASSGNMGAALAALAPHYGVARTLIIVSPGTTEEKINLIQQYGAEVRVAANGIKLAQTLSKRNGYINPNQYQSDENWMFYHQVIAPQIWKQMKGDISEIGVGLGSGGTGAGLKVLKKLDRKIRMLGVVVAEGSSIPGVRTLKRLEEVSQPWRDAVDEINFVTAEEAYRESQKLRGHGLNFGPSSGFVQVGLLNHIQSLKDRGNLDMLRNSRGEIRAVYIAPDGPGPYLDEYSKYINKEEKTLLPV